MDTRKRAERFARYVGLELKGAIIARGKTAKWVAQRIDRQDATLNRWLNGKGELPLDVLCAACEQIGMEPRQIVEVAYDRMVYELGERGALAEVTSLASHRAAADDHLAAASESADTREDDRTDGDFL